MTRARLVRFERDGAAVPAGRPFRWVPLVLAVVALSVPVTDSADAQGPDTAAASRAASTSPRRVTGRVVRPTASATVGVGGAWVTLHRVAPDSSGPVDSVRTDASGGYTMRYRPTAGDAVYFASSSYGGVAYFTAPLPAGDAIGESAEITVFDTTSAHVPVRTRGRHLVVSSSAVNGRRTLVEVFELSNDTTVTAVPGAQGRATWSTPLAPNAADFQVGQSDIGNAAVQFRDGRALVFASIAPGIRQVAFSYTVPAADFPLLVPVADTVSVLEVLLEDPGASATGGGLVEQPSVSLEGRNFRRFLAQDIPAGAPVTIALGTPTGVGRDRRLVVPVLVAALVMVGALVFALTRRRPARVVVATDTPATSAHLARDIADLDAAFDRTPSPTDAERAAYLERRATLKARLTDALAKEHSPA